MTKNPWVLKKLAIGRRYLSKPIERGERVMMLPMVLVRRAKKSSMNQNEILLTEKRHKHPDMVLQIQTMDAMELRWGYPALPEALDGRKVKITIEILE